MKNQMKMKVLATMLVLTSLFCFVYLNTRDPQLSISEMAEIKTDEDTDVDMTSKQEEPEQLIIAGVSILIKALVLSEK